MRGLNLRFRDREEFVSAEQFNGLMKVLLDHVLFGVLESEPEYEGDTVSICINCCYYDATEEDDPFPVVHIDKYNKKTGKMENLVLNGYPDCFEELGFDLEFVSNFFHGDGWWFNIIVSYEYEESGWDRELRQYDYIDIVKPEVWKILLINPSNMTIEYKGQETNEIDITNFFTDDVKKELTKYIIEETEEDLIEYIRED